MALSGGNTLITLNNIYRTDLLMARTRLRLGESLACMVYLHRWNCHKHLVFYSIALGFHVFCLFFFIKIILADGIQGGNRKRLDRHLQNHALPRNSTWTWKQVEGFRETSSFDRQTIFVLFSLYFFIFPNLYPEKKTELQAKLSLRLDHHLQHQCVKFFHNFIQIVIGNTFYLWLLLL